MTQTLINFVGAVIIVNAIAETTEVNRLALSLVIPSCSVPIVILHIFSGVVYFVLKQLLLWVYFNFIFYV